MHTQLAGNESWRRGSESSGLCSVFQGKFRTKLLVVKATLLLPDSTRFYSFTTPSLKNSLKGPAVAGYHRSLLVELQFPLAQEREDLYRRVFARDHGGVSELEEFSE